MMILKLLMVIVCFSYLPLQAEGDERASLLAPNTPVALPRVEFQPLTAEGLSTFVLLTKVAQALDAKGDNLLGEQKNGLPVLKEEIDRLKELVTKFNALEFEKKSEFQRLFVSICNSVNPNNFQPRHARELVGRLEKFDITLFKYFFKNKGTMTPDEKALFDQLVLFNHYLRQCLINEDLFDYSFGELWIDTTWFTPVEWVAANPWLTAGIVVATAAAVYWATRPSRYGVVFAQGWTNHCGAYAALNALLIATPGAKVTCDIDMEAAFADIRSNIEKQAPAANASAAARAEHAARVDRFPESPKNLEDDQIRNVLAEPLFLAWAGKVMGNVVTPRAPENFEVLGELLRWAKEDPNSAHEDAQIERVQRLGDSLKAGKSCIFICPTVGGNSPFPSGSSAAKSWAKGCQTHWVVVELSKNKANEVEALVYDSLQADSAYKPYGATGQVVDEIKYRWL